MTASLLDPGVLRTLGWALFATVWQAGLIYGGLRVLLRVVAISRCRVRYRAALASAAVALLLSVATTAWLLGDWRVHARCWSSSTEWVHAHGAVCQSHGRPGSFAVSADAVPVAASVDGMVRTSRLLVGSVPRPVLDGARRITPALGWLALLWVVGVALASARTLLDVARLERARKDSDPVTDSRALGAFDLVRRELGLPPSVTLRTSDAVTSPGTAGWRKPTVLLPPGLVRALNPGELRYLFAHELGHTLGRDYPIGLAQLMAERVFSFNPFAGLISRIISEEREALRDRMAVSMGGSARGYAQMLLRLEGWCALRRSPTGLVPLAGERPLLGRVRRLVIAEPDEAPGGGTLLSATAVALLLFVLLGQSTSLGRSLGSWAVMSLDVDSPRTTLPDRPTGGPHARD